MVKKRRYSRNFQYFLSIWTLSFITFLFKRQLRLFFSFQREISLYTFTLYNFTEKWREIFLYTYIILSRYIIKKITEKWMTNNRADYEWQISLLIRHEKISNIYITILLFGYSINKKKYCIPISSNLTIRTERQISKIVKLTHWFAVFGQYRARICYPNRIFDGIENGWHREKISKRVVWISRGYVCGNLFVLGAKVISRIHRIYRHVLWNG